MPFMPFMPFGAFGYWGAVRGLLQVKPRSLAGGAWTKQRFPEREGSDRSGAVTGTAKA
jgi:hypothetical protein